jgi:hypothetical protein
VRTACAPLKGRFYGERVSGRGTGGSREGSANRARRLAGTSATVRTEIGSYSTPKSSRRRRHGWSRERSTTTPKRRRSPGYPRIPTSRSKRRSSRRPRRPPHRRSRRQNLGPTRSSDRDARDIARAGVSNEEGDPAADARHRGGFSDSPVAPRVFSHAAASRAAFMRTTGSDRPMVTALKRSWRGPSAT